MDWSLVQPRNYDDTFNGGDYHRDMQESPELQVHFLAEELGPSEEPCQTERQKQLRRKWQEKKSGC